MAFLPPVHHNSETLSGELSYRREKLRPNAPSVFGYVWPLMIAPFQLVWWVLGRAILQSTGRQLIGAHYPFRRRTRAAVATCKGSGRAVQQGPIARCGDCGKYIGISSSGRLLPHAAR